MSALARDIHVKVRRMAAEDLPAVMDIERRGYEFHWSTINFKECLTTACESIVLLLNDEIIGYGIMMIAVDECHILNVCIDPDFQRQGYGCALLQEMIVHAIVLGAEYAILEVRSSNMPAISMYQSEGFEQIGLRRKYYPDYEGREDALVFMRQLKPLYGMED